VTKNQENSRENMDSERIQRWRWMLEQDVPIIGGWMHRRVTNALIESALAGNWLAAQSLAVVAVFNNDSDVRQMAAETLRKINYSTGIDAVWGVWAETRAETLDGVVVGYRRAANHPASVRLLSALRLSLDAEQSLAVVTRGSADLVAPLIQACHDADSQIAGQARRAIHALTNPDSIDAVCRAWQISRTPFLTEVLQQANYVAQKLADTRVLSALKINRLDLVMHGSPEMVAPLAAACQDSDEEIASRARQCLPYLQGQPTVDAFCQLWSETRSPLLENALIMAGYKARGPAKVRVLAALKTGALNIAEKVPPSGLSALLEATRDVDETIRQNALAALAHLKDENTRDALCQMVIEHDAPDDPLVITARETALAHQYAPREPEMRALFYFLTEQWRAYDGLDFDQSMMRTIYEASPAEMRQRIAAQVQSAGRTDYLTILTGVNSRARAEAVSPSESALMIRILTGNREYARLWSLITDVSLPFALEIMHILLENQWRPESEADAAVFDELSRLSRLPVLLAGPELTRALPLAIPRATLKVKGRVNEVAFSPTQPVLAIATSQRKVVLWNFKTAAVEQVLGDFKHSVGKVNYTPRGVLICAERSSQNALCTVYIFAEPDRFDLCAHEGSVTVLEPVGQDGLLTAGRDQRVFLWNLAAQKKIAEKQYSFWARSAAISPDQMSAALLHDRLALVRLPDLSQVKGYPFLTARADGFKTGVAQNAAFAPDGKYLLAGQYSGQVGLHFHTSLHQRPRKAVVTQHSQPVRGIHFLPGHPVVITAGAEGQVRFIRWPEMTLMGMVYSPEGQLTSLRVSQEGSFMATGTNEASLVLWDLRVQDIPDLFSQPLATASHDQVSTVLALSEYNSLPEPVRNSLHFLRVLLQHRFRYDIQIEEAPLIRFGEFDILLDDVSKEGHG